MASGKEVVGGESQRGGRRKGMMEGDSVSVDVARDVGVWLEGLAEGVDTTQNSQLTCLLCAW